MDEEEAKEQEDQQEEQEEQEQEKQQQSKSAKKRQAADDQLTITVKRRKKNRQDEKAKRDAQIAAADRLAETIFQKSFSCSSCSSLKTTVSSLEEDIRLKDSEITQLKTEIADLTESLKVKKLVVASMELENKQLKTRIGRVKVPHQSKVMSCIQAIIKFNTHDTHSPPPTPSTETISFLANLVDFYKDLTDVSSSSEEACNVFLNACDLTLMQDDLCNLEKTRSETLKEMRG